MTFTGSEDHSITLAEASAMTANYRNANPGETTAHAFGKNAITAIFAQTGCVGMRIYYALDDSGVKYLIIVGLDASGNDLSSGLLAERSYLCPNACSSANSLNC